MRENEVLSKRGCLWRRDGHIGVPNQPNQSSKSYVNIHTYIHFIYARNLQISCRANIFIRNKFAQMLAVSEYSLLSFLLLGDKNFSIAWVTSDC